MAVWAPGDIVAYDPSFPEVPRMEKRPGEFVGVMIGDAYPLPTAHSRSCAASAKSASR